MREVQGFLPDYKAAEPYWSYSMAVTPVQSTPWELERQIYWLIPACPMCVRTQGEPLWSCVLWTPGNQLRDL